MLQLSEENFGESKSLMGFRSNGSEDEFNVVSIDGIETIERLEDIELNSSDKDDEWRKVYDEVEIPKYSFDENKQGTQISKADRPATNLEHSQLFLTDAILKKYFSGD
ncbi:hypothetical protein BB559_000092 [Furculomyces boomerangus]|uniref:Uncharacterized protein n=2 Tax=Harpellales TaxID=61421 RepID=A0A2T9Z6B3_9FUNG|nr:hypothetical protein BB559_000092 [Furculomyces boomerangus]PWA00575.1 hypothetical protein BB558_003389 [Smittium angustum]